MRKPVYPERYYLDFDGFFASCEQFAHPHLRGKPVGVIPMEKGSSCVIAVSREAKMRGIKNVMPLREAQAKCPDMILWPQNPDLYRRAHNELLSEISMVAPIDAVKSIDEITGRLDAVQMRHPQAVGDEIKRRIYAVVGPWISCSIGYGANRLHAKMACKDGKPAGNMVWWPDEAGAHLCSKTFDDIPGIGKNMARRLWRSNIYTVEELLQAPPGQLRGIWRSVQGARMWHALHGYDIEALPTEKSMFGHSRILPPSHRKPPEAREMTRILLVKATRRMRLAGYRARMVMLGLAQIGYQMNGYWSRAARVPEANDYIAVLHALEGLWRLALAEINQIVPVFRVDVCLGEVSPAGVRQLDLLDGDEAYRLEQEALSDAIDALNHRYGSTVVRHGMWNLPPGDHTGQKISYTRIPRREDAW